MKLRICSVFTAVALFVSTALASQTVEIIVPSGTGGPQDRAGRVLQKSLTQIDPSRNYVVMNKPGGAGIVGYNEAVKTGGNARLLIYGTGPFTETSTTLGINRVMDDLEILGPIWTNSLIVVASEKSQIKNIEQLIQQGRNGKINCGASSRYSETVAKSFVKQQKFQNAEVVLTKSTGDLVTLIMNGALDCGFDSVESALPELWKAGRVAIVAQGGDKVNPLLPKIPLLKSYMPNTPNFTAEFWQTVAIPKNNTDKFRAEIRPLLTKMIESHPSTETTQVVAIKDMQPNFFLRFYVNIQRMIQDIESK
jgi:tripartite-type tricarboxylate transporter receptor subunit TctC